MVSAMDSRATVIKIEETEMDDCARCSVSITSDTDTKWVVANVYEDCCLAPTCKKCKGSARRWDRLAHWHEDCYDLSGQPYGSPHVPKKQRKVTRETEDWENE
jgi:hypothetical protein